MRDSERVIAGAGLPGSEENPQEIRFRTWGCAECRAQFKRRDYLSERISSSAEIRGGHPDIDKEIAAEQSWLFDYIDACPHRGETVLIVRKLAEGSEHIVFLDESTRKVIKLTKVGCYGDSYFLNENGKVCQASCSPVEYIVRMSLCRAFLGFKTELMGLTDAGQFVSSQNFVEGELPTQNQVDKFLENAGFKPIKQQCWLWMTLDDHNNEIWIGDARADNFVINESGIVPIDIRMWIKFQPAQ